MISDCKHGKLGNIIFCKPSKIILAMLNLYKLTDHFFQHSTYCLNICCVGIL